MGMVCRLLRLRTRYLWKLAWLVPGVLALTSLALTACVGTPESEGIQHTRDLLAPDVVVISTSTPFPQASATLSLPTEAPERDGTATVTAVQFSTVAGTPTPTLMSCDHAYFFEPSPDVCPDGPDRESFAAEQPFERGFMIWLEASDTIYVFDWDGSWHSYEDIFEEGQQEYDPAIIPPAGMYQPVRGFGEVWRKIPDVREQLGWALGRELAYESALQAQQRHAEDPMISFIRAFNGQILALTSRTSRGGDWVIAAS